MRRSLLGHLAARRSDRSNPDRSERDGGTVAIVEWRHTGHRLAYVRVVVDGARILGLRPVLVTARAVLDAEPFRVHLGDVPEAELAIEARELPGSLASVLREQRRLGRSLVLPEADRHLGAVLRLAVTRGLPPHTSVIVMRPPRWRDGWRAWPAALRKTVLLAAMMTAARRTRTLLLEDPLASGTGRVWPRPFRGERWRLDDPVDLTTSASPCLPPELASVPDDTPVVAIVGAITSDKRPLAVLDAWTASDPGAAGLVIAGMLAADLREPVLAHPAVQRHDVQVVDRYLSAAELGGVIRRADAVFVLQDARLSSGTLLAAAHHRRRVIVRRGTRVAAVAERAGFAVVVDQVSPDAIGRAVRSIANAAPLPGLDLSGRDAFARRVLWRSDRRQSDDGDERSRFVSSGSGNPAHRST